MSNIPKLYVRRKPASMSQKTIDHRLREALERRQRASLWGQQYLIKPRLCDKIFGDGRQLVGFEPLDARPSYYIVRVDSA
jgi:hypothetical protein